jgi:hypothetical protein
MSEYLVLLKLNPGKLIETLSLIRNTPTVPIPGVDLCYSMNIFGAWDVGIWINAENSGQALDFVQRKVKDIVGVTEVYTVPTFPHGNIRRKENLQKAKQSEEEHKPVLEA